MTVIHSPATPSPDQGAGREARHCATCRCDTSHLCECGHLDVHHDLPKRKAGYVRTRCDWTDAKNGQADPCDCIQYRPKEAT